MVKLKRILSVSSRLSLLQPAVERAALIAKAFDAELRIQSITFRPFALASLFHLDAESERAEKTAIREGETRRLASLVEGLDTGSATHTDVRWGHPFDENTDRQHGQGSGSENRERHLLRQAMT